MSLTFSSICSLKCFVKSLIAKDLQKQFDDKNSSGSWSKLPHEQREREIQKDIQY